MKSLLLALALLPATSMARAQAPQWEPARRADDFVDAIGVATHWSYGDTPYGYAYDRVKVLLGESGVRHVRDGLHPREADLYASYGIRATTILGPGKVLPVEQIKSLEPALEYIAMIEGPNEVDIFPANAAYNGKTFPEGAREYQNDLYAALRANPKTAHLELIAPSTARHDSNQKLAPLKSFDYLVMHSYAGGQSPSSSLDGPVISNLRNAPRILGPGEVIKPIVVTESGYHTALGANLTLGGVQPGVSETAHAKYIPRHFAEYWNAGIRRTFIYEFLDEFKDEQTNAEASFGIVRRDLTPKPAYVALKNLIALLNESTWNAQAKRWESPWNPINNREAPRVRAVKMQLSGDTKNVHHTLLQKANGDYYLLLWQEVSSFDTHTQKEVTNAPANVTLTLDRSTLDFSKISMQTFLPSRGIEALDELKPATKVQLSIPDEILVVRITAPRRVSPLFAPNTFEIRTSSTGSAVQLSWAKLPSDVGFFVWRGQKYLGFTTQSTFTDTRLTPNSGYVYNVQAVSSVGFVTSGQGVASQQKSVTAFTKDESPDLIVTDVALQPATPKAGEAAKLVATVKNIGNGSAVEGITHGVAFFIDNQFVAWSDTRNTPIAPNESVQLTANNGPKGIAQWTATLGAHTLAALVDDVNRITEKNEQNNRLEKPIDVK